MIEAISRPYTPDDFSACLAIFDSNVPTYFAPEERADCCECLGNVNAEHRPYIVLTRNGSVIACGGLTAETVNRQARLAWVMVDSALHGQGLGTSLTQAILTLARTTPDIAEVGLATSQHILGFYEGFGFTLSNIIPDGFGPGLDRCDMTLRLT